MCINILYVCDGINDCLENEDEEDCLHENQKFKCFNSYDEISYKLLCNQVKDCSDNSDEIFCSKFFFCLKIFKCLRMTNFSKKRKF